MSPNIQNIDVILFDLFNLYKIHCAYKSWKTQIFAHFFCFCKAFPFFSKKWKHNKIKINCWFSPYKNHEHTSKLNTNCVSVAAAASMAALMLFLWHRANKLDIKWQKDQEKKKRNPHCNCVGWHKSK